MLKHFASNKIIAGIDEAGRGCIAGPVVAAAVILPKDFFHPLLNDSKQLNEKQREELKPIIESSAISFGIGIIDNTIIDKVNILQATYLAMHQAIDNLKQKPELLLIDGNRFKPYNNIEHQTIIKGDATYVEIAAASILAKTYRDELMLAYDSQFPKYQWQKNKGYPTPEHKKAVWTFGYTPLHRITFNINKQLSLF
ncbi:MAG: ribonuclease HII [Sphingobacteriales bacterium]|jgi:ribonuclease HII|nr:MAG: ribonuclease HII [Sphingobacteriales bacterium]